jgi:hypothetical protein
MFVIEIALVVEPEMLVPETEPEAVLPVVLVLLLLYYFVQISPSALNL